MPDKKISAMTETATAAGEPITSANKLAAVTLICVMLGGAWQFISASQQVEWQDVPHAWTDFREGKTSNALEKQLNQKLPARTTLIAAANSLRYLLFHSGGDQVRIGRDGWLFFTDELRFHANANSHLIARAALLGAASTALERDGVKLVVALVPDKTRVYPEHLAKGRIPEYNRSRYQDALSALQARNVNVVDLLEPLAAAAKNDEVYYRSDTHWNQAGAQIAAQAIAAEVRRLNAGLDTTTFATEKSAAETERPGDLIRLMGLENAPNLLRPPPDHEALMITRQTSADSGGGLFGDASVPVVLTGTSYSLRGNFHGFMQQALAAKVLNAAKDGGGFLQATTQYLKDEAFRSSKPKVLIWEVPERFLGAEPEDETEWMKAVGLRPKLQ
jgi:alginate O-acetyltransferase complex protein AlgJ